MNITQHFAWSEFLYLPQWKVEHIPSEDEKANIILLVNKMEEIRSLLNKPINIHCGIRPILNNKDSEYNGKDYNEFVKGAKQSAHKIGLAADWDANEDCDITRAFLLPYLEQLNIRMENKEKSGWIHIDLEKPNPNRFFIP